MQILLICFDSLHLFLEFLSLLLRVIEVKEYQKLSVLVTCCVSK